MAVDELAMFFSTWDREAANTVRLLKALPADQYDFRPDPEGRSLGELAWHLAEGDAYMSFGVANEKFAMENRPPNLDRPKTTDALVQGFERVHQEAVARLKKLGPQDLDRTIQFFTGPMTIRNILW